MNEELTDVQIAALVKAALDNNAAIVQYCAFIYGQDATTETRRKWRKTLTSQWETYEKHMKYIFGNKDSRSVKL